MGSILLSLFMVLNLATVDYENAIEAREAKNTIIRQDLNIVKLAETEKVEKQVIKRESKEEDVWMTFTLTAYTNGPESTGKRPGNKGYAITASGKRTVEGRTIAADPRVLPMGTKVYIEGVGQRVVEDTGSAIKGQKIDVFIDDLDRALEFGRKKNVRVKIIE
ncbi:3D domain-containing protein [Paenibacillus lautus]|uniref:3D domain-containing protein n=1 Tax=Paenibacillus lautus TaxID=1401 RepID=UPI0020407F21|nr:3D domain-containing protein [Paenibacillus lautus]MCM3257041.1 3D domain-containing protein [Paenibacillus lautus]